jgi:hypothetical protein
VPQKYFSHKKAQKAQKEIKIGNGLFSLYVGFTVNPFLCFLCLFVAEYFCGEVRDGDSCL